MRIRGSRRSGGEVVQLEDAVKMLAEQLVRPALPRVARAPQDQSHRHMTPEKEQAVAQQIHTAVILYNYYHRKMFPLLGFADAKRFLMCACISVGEDLLAYSALLHVREENSGEEDVRLSVTDRAARQACEISVGLNAGKDSPDMAMWPVSKVAVLLLDPTRKKCLVENGAITKGVWSIVEKEIDATAGISHTTSLPAGQGSTKKRSFGTFDGPYMLQQLALSEVERRTGMKSSDLCVLDETLAYSLSKERTTTKLFVVEYRQTMNAKFVEMSLQELISSMTGPVFVSDPFPKTSSVVDYYHILPYKEILFELLHRNWPADSSLNEQSRRRGLHPARDENLEKKDANITLKMRKQITEVATPKHNKRAIKATGVNRNQNSNTSKQKKNKKETFEASMAAAAEALLDLSKVGDATADVSGGPIALESGVQERKTQKKSTCSNTHQDGVPAKAICLNPVMKNSALEPQNMEVTEKPGGVTENNDDWVYDSLRSFKKIRHESHHKEHILHERRAQCEMDFQTILNEGKMTPKVLSIINTDKEPCSNVLEDTNSSCTRNGVQTMSIERKTLREGLHVHNKCQELDEICNEGNWMLPKYTIVPSDKDGKFRAIVHLKGPDFEISTTGGLCRTPCKARCSAAVNMIIELHRKGEEEEEEEEEEEQEL